nr:hypothetical protein Iba_chr10dCG0810 [Ipomoea batatas]
MVAMDVELRLNLEKEQRVYNRTEQNREFVCESREGKPQRRDGNGFNGRYDLNAKPKSFWGIFEMEIPSGSFDIVVKTRKQRQSQVKLAANRLGELAIPVAEQQDFIFDPQILLPGLHHERVVDRNASDRVHALRLDLRRLLHEPGEVLLGAGGGERARDGEEDGLLAGGEVGDGHGLEVVGGGFEEGERRVGELVADGDNGGDFGRGGESKRAGAAAEMGESEGECGGDGRVESGGFGGEESEGFGGGGS